jgi:uncharacterized membrane protein
MRTSLTFLSGASLGAGLMYLMDPERGDTRRAELRGALADLGESEMVERALERARQLELPAAVREMGGDMLERPASWWSSLRASDAPAALRRAARRRGYGDWTRWGRRREPRLDTRDWALLGGLLGAAIVGIWLGRRALNGAEAIEVAHGVTIEAPVERVWEFWNDVQNFPRFMSYVRDVRSLGGDRSHWTVSGPGGVPVEWDAVVTERVPNQVLSWRTVEGALVEHSGTVRFQPAGPGATRVDVRLSYRPAGGALGRGVASLFGADPERVIGEDLARVAAQLRGPRAAVGETGSWR